MLLMMFGAFSRQIIAYLVLCILCSLASVGMIVYEGIWATVVSHDVSYDCGYECSYSTDLVVSLDESYDCVYECSYSTDLDGVGFPCGCDGIAPPPPPSELCVCVCLYVFAHQLGNEDYLAPPPHRCRKYRLNRRTQ